jgi:hypothetical protein
MTTEELREVTREFDDEFIADKARPMTPQMKARWERAQTEPPGKEDGPDEQTITVHLDKSLLTRCTALARKKRISRDTLITRGLKALLAAEGEL